MLVLRPRNTEAIKLRDTVSGLVVIIKTFIKENGDWHLGFDCPKTVEITREPNRKALAPKKNKQELVQKKIDKSEHLC